MNALAIRDREDFVSEGQRTRIEHMLHTETAQVCAFSIRSGGGENLCAGTLGEVNRRHTNTSGTGVYQYAFAAREVTKLEQGVIRSQVGDGQRRSSVERHAFRHSNGQCSIGRDMRSQRRRRERDDAFADAPASDTIANRSNVPGALTTNCTGIARVRTEDVQYVLEIESGRSHPNHDLACRGGRHNIGRNFQRLDRATRRGSNAIHRRELRRSDWRMINSRDEPRVDAQRDLRFRVRRTQFTAQRVELCGGYDEWQVNAGCTELWVFELERAHNTEHCRLRGVRCAVRMIDTHRTLGHERQSWPIGRVGVAERQNCLCHRQRRHGDARCTFRHRCTHFRRCGLVECKTIHNTRQCTAS